MSNHNKLDSYIATLESLLEKLKDERDSLVESQDCLAEFTSLRQLANSHSWPAAAHRSTLCDPLSEAHKTTRANDILLDVVPLEGLAFLDFGCGEGHVANAAMKQSPAKSIGFDIEEQWHDPIAMLTTDFKKVEDAGPYDVILCHDVLDHLVNDSQIEILKKLKSLRKSNGPIYLRCHPWTSRHATHLYHQLNKAYLHLAFTEEELLKLGCKGIPCHRSENPMGDYRSWFRAANLSIMSEMPINSPIEEFFLQTKVGRRIKKNLGGIIPKKICSVEFIDYILA